MEKKRDSLLPNPLEEFSRAFEAVDRRGRQVFRRMRVPFRLSRMRVKGGDEIMDFIYFLFIFSIRKSYLRREIDESAMLESRNRQFEATSLVKLGRR